MKTKGIIGSVLAVILLMVVTARAAPVDHVFVSNNKLDKLNLDGSLDTLFLPGSTDGLCRQLAVDGNTGNVWLACEGLIDLNCAVYMFDSLGNVIHECYDPNLEFCWVEVDGGMCIDPFGNAWITDRPNGQVWKFQPDGNRRDLPYSTGGTNSGAIACDRFGNVWTANTSSCDVSKLDNNGNLIGVYPVPCNPFTIGIDQFDNIWTGGGGITKLANDGSILGSYPLTGVATSGIAIDNAGNVWFSRGADDLVTKISSSGVNLGNFAVSSPWDIAIDASGNAWVVNLNGVMKLANDGTNLGTFPLSGNSGQNDTGFLHQRFVLGYNSVEGPDVWVPLNGGAPAGAVTLWFDYINTMGNSSYIESGSGTSPPDGYELGTPPRYYDITTTATYSGQIQVCIGYNETEFFNEVLIRLFHNAGSWTNVTTTLDTTNNIICGMVNTLAEFAVLQPTGSSNTYPPTPNLHFYGDADGDTLITGIDVNQANAYILSKPYSVDTLQPANPMDDWNTMDVNSDRLLDGQDINQMNAFILSKPVTINSLPWILENDDGAVWGIPPGGNPSGVAIPFQINLKSTHPTEGLSGRAGLSVIAEINPASPGSGSLSGRDCNPDSGPTGPRDQANVSDDQCAIAVTITDWDDLGPDLGLTESGGYGFTITSNGDGDLILDFEIEANPAFDIPAVTLTLNVSF